MQVAIVSDTHIPSRATEVPEPFRKRIVEADHVLHAGDFDAESSLELLRDMTSELTAVKGNMDRNIGLPPVESAELDGVEFVVTHGTGPKRGYENRVANTVRQHGGKGAIGVSGHTHEPMDTVHNGIRLLNPGSVTGASPATRATMMTADIADGELDVTLHEL